ncbi:lysozyme family protein [Paracoccus sp. T5]|uniref:hypothetical protein n=1 Tax=Paracoccus sp. T5 TaxID=3402161 RepID=UPI003AE327A3
MKSAVPTLLTILAVTTAHATDLGDAPADLASEIQRASALYATEPAADPHKAVVLAETPVEMIEIYAALDERLPPMKIYSFTRDDDVPEADVLQSLLPTTFTPGSAEDLIISYIRRFEAGKNGYNAVWHGNRTPLPSRPTDMTVCEVRDWQIAAARRQASTAIGLFQIVGGTYRSLLNRVNLPCNTPFDQKTQDMLGLALLMGRGWQEFKAGRMTVEDFGFELAGEWAAFPAPYGKDKGFSRYRGIAGNRHQVELRDYMAFLRDLDQKIRAGDLPLHDDDAAPASPALPEIVFVSNENDRQDIRSSPVIRVMSFNGN